MKERKPVNCARPLIEVCDADTHRALIERQKAALEKLQAAGGYLPDVRFSFFTRISTRRPVLIAPEITDTKVTILHASKR